MNKKPLQWAVIGAGPAGIAAVGKLIDSGIEPQAILWIDPHFAVGDLGNYWRNVSSNTSVKLFLAFLKAVKVFGYNKCPIDFPINHLPEDNTCTLKHIVEPLQWVSSQLCQQVQTEKTFIHKMELSDRVWHLNSDSTCFKAKNVILANGAVPQKLNYPEIQEIDFYTAIDKEKLSASVEIDKTYAVFGSSHSAILILKYLVDLGVKKIINFYQSPTRYAINMGDWILFDNSGLKGSAAQWSRENLDGKLPNNLVRYVSTEANIAKYLPQCDQAIYAVGFRRQHNIEIGDYSEIHYNPHLGIIAPGLFGIGIAYPELLPNPYGSSEYQVGLWKFMVYLQKIIPVWLQYPT